MRALPSSVREPKSAALSVLPSCHGMGSRGSVRQNNHDLHSFAYAAHSIADFYAHTSCAHFAKHTSTDAGSPIQTYDPHATAGHFETPPDYSKGSTFDLTGQGFTVNPHYWHGTKEEAAAAWKGKIISCRYAQKGDPRQGIIEKRISIPKELEKP